MYQGIGLVYFFETFAFRIIYFEIHRNFGAKRQFGSCPTFSSYLNLNYSNILVRIHPPDKFQLKTLAILNLI